MKTSLLCSATIFSLAAFAFPANVLSADVSGATPAEITALVAKNTLEANTKRQAGLNLLKPGFDANAQRISTTGDHRYVCISNLKDEHYVADHQTQIAPGPNDIHGPCPGLNVMANHGYLPRNGVASIAQFTTASVDGMPIPAPQGRGPCTL